MAAKRQLLYRRGPALFMAPPLTRPEKDEES
jgi:hypothetical protein